VNSSSTEPHADTRRVGDLSPPALSVIVVTISPVGVLRQCLEALVAGTRSFDVEILVVTEQSRVGGSVMGLDAFKDVRWIMVPQGCTVPRMRSVGMERSHGALVALIEDDCVVEPGWCEAILSAQRAGGGVVAGAVEPGGYRRGLDWAVYFCDYVRFMLPFRAAPAAALPGNNVSFPRAALAVLPADAVYHFTEFQAYQHWRRTATPMRVDPAIRVRNAHAWSFADVTRVAYHHGRAFAGLRLARAPRSRRLMMAAATPLLPVLKVARLVRETVSRRRFVGRLVQALPWIVLFTASWSTGEAVGALFGAGNSAAKWR
jgi:hypothetical protein